MAKSKEYHILTLIGSASVPIPCSPAQYLARLWVDENERLKQEPGTEMRLPAIIYSQRITESEFNLLRANVVMPKAPAGPLRILNGEGGRG